MEENDVSHGTSDSSSSGLLIDLSDRVSDSCLTRTISCSGSLTATSCSSTEAVEEPGDKAIEEAQQQTCPTVESNDWWWLKPLPNPEDKDYKLLRPIDEEEFDFEILDNTSSSSSESDYKDDSFDLEEYIMKKRRPVAPSPLILAKMAESQEPCKMSDSTATQPGNVPISVAPSLVVNITCKVTLDKEALEKDSLVLTSEVRSCVESVSVAELPPVELDQSCYAANDDERDVQQDRVTSLVEDCDDKQDVTCEIEPVVNAWNEEEKSKEEEIDKSKDSLDSEREVRNITVNIIKDTSTASSDSIRSSEENSSESRSQLDIQPQTEEEREVSTTSTGKEEEKVGLGDSRCSSSSSEIDGNRTKFTDSAQSSRSSSTASSPGKSTSSQSSTTTKHGLKHPLKSALTKPTAAAGKATKTATSAEGRFTKPSSTKIHVLPQTFQTAKSTNGAASSLVRTKTFRVKRGTRPDSKQPVLQRPSIPPITSSPPKPARKNIVRSQLSSPAKVSLPSRKPTFNKAARPLVKRPFSQQGTKKTATASTGEQNAACDRKATDTIENEAPASTDEPVSQASLSPIKESTPIKTSSTSPLSSQTVAQTLNFSLSSIESKCSDGTDKQSSTFTKHPAPPSPPRFLQEPTVTNKPAIVPTKRRSIPRPATGLLKSSTAASNIPKSSVSGLSKGAPSARIKCFSKLPRTNTRTAILRAQKLLTKVEKVNQVAKMPKVVHSPVNKENQPASPHSEWSPIRRQKSTTAEESYIICTKHTRK